MQFSAKVTGNSNQAVTWAVNGVVTGNATVGTMDSKGVYHAPANLPTPNSVKVQAVSVADKSLSASSAITLENPIPLPQTVNPTLLPVGSFSVSVGGANFAPGATVLFGGTALATTFVSSSQLTATGTSTAAQKGTVPITVQNPDPGKVVSSASLNVQVGAAGNVTVTVVPATVQVHAGDTFGFTTAVNGAGAMTAVKWSINGIPNGNATLGTITAGGVYTAPMVVPTPNTLQVTATSVADTTASSTGTITLSNPLPVVTAVLPTSIPVGNFTLSVAGQKFISGAVVSFGGTFLPTQFVSANELTATGSASSAGTVQITVINPDPGSATSNQFALEVGTPANELSATAAARLLEQSTWGVNPQSLSHAQAEGMQAFLNEQFAAPISTFPAPATTDDITVVQKRFFTNALTGQDQLRQRVGFALSQIMVASATKVNNPSAFVLWANMFQKDAFGNFATLLNDVTLSPVMGNYLDMVNNDKPNPATDSRANENYARESMQLFSVGLNLLNQDGTPQLDGSGNPIPTYTQDTITNFARVYTGWTYPTKPGATARFFNPEYYGGPMVAIDSHHDTGAKTLLNGGSIPAGGTAQSDLTAALQNVFTHPNVAPFICSQLIQHLVTSNPSPEYVSRVAAVFNDNGSGVRGDLKAVVQAILLDTEARRGDDPAQAQPNDGHLKEPILFITNLLRAMNATSDGTGISDRASDMKQSPFFAPSVFNFFPPNFVIQGTTLLGPEFAIFNTSTTISRTNFVNDLVYGQVNSGTAVSLTGYVPLAANPSELVDAISAVMLHGQVSDDTKNTLVTTLSSISDNTQRTQAAFYLIGSSSQFQVEH